MNIKQTLCALALTAVTAFGCATNAPVKTDNTSSYLSNTSSHRLRLYDERGIEYEGGGIICDYGEKRNDEQTTTYKVIFDWEVDSKNLENLEHQLHEARKKCFEGDKK